MIIITNTIQPGEHSVGGGMNGASHVSDGNPNVLNSNRNDDGSWVNTNWDKPDNQWNDNGACAFLVPATLFISRPRLLARACFVALAVRSNRQASFRLRPVE